MNNSKELGELGEDMATAYLKGRGYTVIQRNYRCPAGEIDIIAKDRGCTVFIEVKSRSSELFGEPEDAVTVDKQMKLSKSALFYIKENHLEDTDARFDIVSVKITEEEQRIDLFQNAFEFLS